MLIGSIVTLVALIGLLIFIFQNHRLGCAISKPIASAGFLYVAFVAGAFQTTYGIALFIALVLSWFGDVFLLSNEKKFFLMGLGSFLLAHLAFGAAFAMRGFHVLWGLVAFVCLAPIATLVIRWLRPHVDQKMWRPVLAYISVIVFMVTMSIAAYPTDRLFLIQLAALMFFVSDLAVARNRFIHRTPYNRLWGLPLYYGAQLIFATTISMLAT